MAGVALGDACAVALSLPGCEPLHIEKKFHHEKADHQNQDPENERHWRNAIVAAAWQRDGAERPAQKPVSRARSPGDMSSRPPSRSPSPQTHRGKASHRRPKIFRR